MEPAPAGDVGRDPDRGLCRGHSLFGIYLASMVLIALFMLWLGRYRWPITAAISIGVPVAFYFMFEKWFLVPLPKGPIEDWLGL